LNRHRILGHTQREVWNDPTGAVSVQVLQEFYVNITRKIPSAVSREQDRSVLNDDAGWSTETRPAEILTAFRMEDESGINF
jgi:hypothetical protein